MMFIVNIYSEIKLPCVNFVKRLLFLSLQYYIFKRFHFLRCIYKMSEIREQLKISIKHKKASGYLYVVNFQDHGHHIAYAESLNLSGYGPTREDALDMLFKHVLDDFFDGLFDLPEAEIFDVLEGFGWKRSQFFKKDLSKTAHVDTNGILRNFNLSEETEIEANLMAV